MSLYPYIFIYISVPVFIYLPPFLKSTESRTPHTTSECLRKFLLLEPDFADNTSATPAPAPYASNWGGRGGCLGFFVHLFSLFGCIHKYRQRANETRSDRRAQWGKYTFNHCACLELVTLHLDQFGPSRWLLLLLNYSLAFKVYMWT